MIPASTGLETLGQGLRFLQNRLSLGLDMGRWEIKWLEACRRMTKLLKGQGDQKIFAMILRLVMVLSIYSRHCVASNDTVQL